MSVGRQGGMEQLDRGLDDQAAVDGTGQRVVRRMAAGHLGFCVTQRDTELVDGSTGATLEVKGELDAATAPMLATSVRMAVSGGAAALVIDLAGCGFIDGRGITVLIEAVRLNEQGCVTSVAGATGTVRRILMLVGLSRFADERGPDRRGLA